MLSYGHVDVSDDRACRARQASVVEGALRLQ